MCYLQWREGKRDERAWIGGHCINKNCKSQWVYCLNYIIETDILLFSWQLSLKFTISCSLKPLCLIHCFFFIYKVEPENRFRCICSWKIQDYKEYVIINIFSDSSVRSKLLFCHCFKVWNNYFSSSYYYLFIYSSHPVKLLKSKFKFM